MSSRVRFAGTHPNYGSVTGGKAVYYIKHSWDSRFPRSSGERIYPLGYKKWPHWKRTLWMANMEGTWKVKVFREPRGTNIKKSLYGKRMLELGLVFKKPKKKVQDVVRKANRLYHAGGINPIDGVMPPPPVFQAQAIPMDWRWGQQANQVFGNQAQQVAGNQGQVAPNQAPQVRIRPNYMIDPLNNDE